MNSSLMLENLDSEKLNQSANFSVTSFRSKLNAGQVNLTKYERQMGDTNCLQGTSHFDSDPGMSSLVKSSPFASLRNFGRPSPSAQGETDLGKLVNKYQVSDLTSRLPLGHSTQTEALTSFKVSRFNASPQMSGDLPRPLGSLSEPIGSFEFSKMLHHPKQSLQGFPVDKEKENTSNVPHSKIDTQYFNQGDLPVEDSFANNQHFSDDFISDFTLNQTAEISSKRAKKQS